MKAFLEDEQTDVPPDPADQETSHEHLAYRIRTCFTFAALAASLEEFMALYNGQVVGVPPRLHLGQGLVWEFEEWAAETDGDEPILYIRRVCVTTSNEGATP